MTAATISARATEILRTIRSTRGEDAMPDERTATDGGGLLLELDTVRSCLLCKHYLVCFMRRHLDAMPEEKVRYLNASILNPLDTPGTLIHVEVALAHCCVLFTQQFKE